jgi:glycosidase
MKVIMDWVANHTGWDHHWTLEHPDWYERDPATGDFKKASGMDDIIELDFSNSHMRQAMKDAMKFWVKECDIDGFRCDLAFWVELHFWKEAIPELNRLKPLFWLAESDPLENPAYMEFFDAAYTWTWMHHTEEFCKGATSFRELVTIAERYQSAPGLKAWFTSNHDENSWNGTEYEKYGHAALMLAVHSCTWPGLPLVYSGQELPNKKRLEFFDRDPIAWTGTYELHGFYKALLALQLNHPALHASAELYILHCSPEHQLLSYLRRNGEHEIIILLNFSPFSASFDLKTGWISGNFTELFSHEQRDFSSQRHFNLGGWEFKVYRK